MVPSDPSPMGHRPDSSTEFDALLGRVKIAPARFVRSGFIGDRQVPYNAARAVLRAMLGHEKVNVNIDECG